jgi:hypothetical protein
MGFSIVTSSFPATPGACSILANHAISRPNYSMAGSSDGRDLSRASDSDANAPS